MNGFGKAAAQVRAHPLELFTGDLGLKVYIKSGTLHLLRDSRINH